MNENTIAWASVMIWIWHESDTSKTRLEPVHLFSHFTSRTNFLFYNSEFRGLTKGLENDKGWQTPICLVSELVQVQPLG